MHISKIFILKILISVVLVVIVAALAVGVSTFLTQFAIQEDIAHTQETQSQEQFTESVDPSEIRAVAIQQAQEMHIEGNAQPTDLERTRMEEMNSQTSDLSIEERRAILKAMQ